jgi:uncharacterized protein (TIGR03067 family)
MFRWSTVFAPLALLLLSGAIQAEDAKKDLEQLQGTWEIVEVVSDGQAAPADKVKGGQVVFKDDEMTLKESSDDKDPRKFRIQLDPSKKPKALDSTALNRDYKGSVTLAIYELDGDTLKLCAPNNHEAKKDRPKAFKSEGGSELVLLTLKQVKK